MKKGKVWKKFLEELEKTPIISVACEKVGISRNSIYRWRLEDYNFAEQVDAALELGIGFVNDVAEGNVLRGIKQGDSGMTKYWLSSRHKAYKRPFRVTQQIDDIDLEEERRENERVNREIDEWERGWTEMDQKSKEKSKRRRNQQ